jgi:hypothetical protein
LTDAARPRSLVWATNVIYLQTTAELAYVAGRHELTVGLRVALIAVVALQYLFARGALRMSAGSVLGLLAFEAMAVVAAIGGDGALVIRGALAFVSIGVIVLLMVSITAFPSPDLPKIT